MPIAIIINFNFSPCFSSYDSKGPYYHVSSLYLWFTNEFFFMEWNLIRQLFLQCNFCTPVLSIQSLHKKNLISLSYFSHDFSHTKKMKSPEQECWLLNFTLLKSHAFFNLFCETHLRYTLIISKLLSTIVICIAIVENSI